MNEQTGSKKKIAFLCLPGLTNFIEPIIDHFEAQGHSVRRVFTGAGHILTNALEWADVIWLEWANELAISLTNAKNIDQLRKKMIVRLHSYEAITSLAKRINWKPVTDVIFVADHVKRYVLKTTSISELAKKNFIKVHVIPNGIKVEDFPFADKDRSDNGLPNNPKFCSLGHMSNKKGPMLLLHAFLHLQKFYDNLDGNNCTLHIGGDWQEERYLYYFNWLIQELKLEDKVFLDGQINNVPQWLEDKYAILCTSPWESQNLGLMEAMCCGVRPLIHNFPGAKEIYNPKWCWSTFDELVDVINSNENKSKDYRDYIQDNYSFDDQIKKVEGVING